MVKKRNVHFTARPYDKHAALTQGANVRKANIYPMPSNKNLLLLLHAIKITISNRVFEIGKIIRGSSD